MAKIGVNLKIDVSKIDKARLFKGQKGTYLDATIFVDTKDFDQFGNCGMITQDISKEEKDQGVQGAILGNGKIFWQSGGDHVPVQNPQQEANFDSTANSVFNDDNQIDDIPF